MAEGRLVLTQYYFLVLIFQISAPGYGIPSQGKQIGSLPAILQLEGKDHSIQKDIWHLTDSKERALIRDSLIPPLLLHLLNVFLKYIIYLSV